jgi:hypothetical protein
MNRPAPRSTPHPSRRDNQSAPVFTPEHTASPGGIHHGN